METIECWEQALKNSKTPSVLSLTRQNLDPIRKKYSNIINVLLELMKF